MRYKSAKSQISLPPAKAGGSFIFGACFGGFEPQPLRGCFVGWGWEGISLFGQGWGMYFRVLLPSLGPGAASASKLNFEAELERSSRVGPSKLRLLKFNFNLSAAGTPDLAYARPGI